MLIVKIDNDSNIPIFRQIANEIIKLIDRKVLNEGDKLPSSRNFASQLGINRITVYRAYQELWSLGFIESRSGSYSTIRKRIIPDNNSHPSSDRNVLISGKYSELSKQYKSGTLCPENIDLLSLSPSPELLPVEKFRKSLSYIFKTEGEKLFGYCEPAGYHPLREFIASIMKRHSVNVNADEILITSGSQGAIDLILRYLTKPGCNIITESPTYCSALPLFKYYNVNINSVPYKDDGMDLEILENKIIATNPALIYSIPNFQNPTGITAGQSYREKLISLCNRYNIPLVEDAFLEEMKYGGKNFLPVKSMDINGLVFYLGTFSKILFPGLRIGWIAASQNHIAELTALKQFADISGNIMNQAAVNHFCRQNDFDLHIRKFNSIFRERMNTAAKAVREYIPSENVSFIKPVGGYLLWLKFNNLNISEETLIEKITQAGVSLSPGKVHYPEVNEEIHLRISIAAENSEKITEAIKIIGKIIQSHIKV